MTVLIGIDGGGSRSVAVAADAEGRELARVEGGPALLEPAAPDAGADRLIDLARRALAAAGAKPPAAALCCALAGAGREAQRASVEAALRASEIATAVRVTTDVRAALEDAFGDGPGLLVIAGTGSIASGRGRDGRTGRAGGWGALLGDEGSGYAIALAALRAIARAGDGRAPPTALEDPVLSVAGVASADALIAWADAASKARIAALAPVAIAAADAGDPAATTIVRHAADELAAHVATLHARLGPWDGLARVAAAGGLLAPGRPLRPHFIASLDRFDLDVRVLPDSVDAARGAARLARTAIA